MTSPSLGFFLFVLCTGVLFVRPTELVESLNDARLYEFSILGCLAVSVPQLLGLLSTRSLKSNPIAFCVVGLLAAVALSHLSRFAIGEAATAAFDFFKAALSFLLLVAVVNTTARLQLFVRWLFVFVLILTTLALLQHHGVIDNPALAAVRENVYDKETGAIIGFDSRLCGAGIFANPNDLSRILVVGIGLSLYFSDGGAPALLRPLWIGAIGVFGYALMLTQSRGGLVALFVTLLVISYFRIGARRTLLLAAMALLVLAVAGGRQTDLSTSEGTGQQRIQLWSDGFAAVQSSPMFGIGMGTYSEITGGLGAHNSFVEAYVELGFFGGTLFLGAVVCALWMCFLLGRRGRSVSDLTLRRIGPYLLAILAGYAAGMLTSSRCYMIPTYLLLGLVVVYLRLARAEVLLPSVRVTPRNAFRFAAFSVVVLVVIQIYILSSVRFGTSS